MTVTLPVFLALSAIPAVAQVPGSDALTRLMEEQDRAAVARNYTCGEFAQLSENQQMAQINFAFGEMNANGQTIPTDLGGFAQAFAENCASNSSMSVADAMSAAMQ